MTTTDDLSRPVRLPRRSRQGVVLGLGGGQVLCLILAGFALLAGVLRLGPLGLLVTAPVYLTLAIFGLATIQGFPAPKMAGLWIAKHARARVGATRQLYRPERVQLEGTINLPGTRASVQVWDVDGLASVYSPHKRSVSITAELEVQGFLMKDVPERFDLAEQWAKVLASFTQRIGVKRVTLQERTSPTTIRAARDHYRATARRLHVDENSPAAVNYQEVLDQSERFAVAHRNFLTLTLDLVAAAPQLRALGGGKDAIQALAAIEAGNVSDALQALKITVRRWLTPRDIAALARTAFDPEFLTEVQNRDDTNAGVDLAAIGPMFLEEPKHRNGIVVTDSGVHTTLWIHEWPRSDAAIGFISPIVFARHPVTGEAVTHILSIVLAPVPVGAALKRIRDEKRVWRGNERLRAKRGADGSAADQADWVALEKQEEEIVAGHGEFRYGAYLTVTAADEEALDQAVAGIRNALSRAGMEAQVLYCQQAEALMVNALPLGMGMT